MSKYDVDVASAAYADVKSIASYIETTSETAALRFADGFTLTLGVLHSSAESPAFCSYRSKRLAGLRKCPVVGFKNHFVFYFVKGRAVRVVRVLHGARNLARVLVRSV